MLTDGKRPQVLQKLAPPGTLSDSSLNEVIKATQVVEADTDESTVAAFMLNQRGFNAVAFMGGLIVISRMPAALGE